MYSKRRYRSNSPYSMYSPYKMNHRPTYRQRKGQTLQRSISLNQGPSSSFTRDDLIREGKRLVNEGIIQYPITFNKHAYSNIKIKDFFRHSSSVPNQYYFYPSDLTEMFLNEGNKIPPIDGYHLEIALGVIEFNISAGQSLNFRIRLTTERIIEPNLILCSKTGGATTTSNPNLSTCLLPMSDYSVLFKTYSSTSTGAFDSSTNTQECPQSQRPVDSGSCGFYPMLMNTDDRTTNYFKYEGDINDENISINICFIYYMITN